MPIERMIEYGQRSCDESPSFMRNSHRDDTHCGNGINDRALGGDEVFNPNGRMTSTIAERGGTSNPILRNIFSRSAVITGDNRSKRKYPKDSFSFVALNGPTIETGTCCWEPQKLKFFCFGLVPFLLQDALLSSLVRVLGDKTEIGKVRPGLAVRLCQSISVVAYLAFPNQSQMALLKAIQMFPWCSATNDDPQTAADVPVGCIRLSCLLRIIQANMAIICFFLVTMSCCDIVEIILNHTIVNFISAIGDMAFRHAHSGVYGPTLAKEAHRIANTDLPACSSRSSDHVWYSVIILFCSILLSGLTIGCMMMDKPNSFWISRFFFLPNLLIRIFLWFVIVHSTIKSFWNRIRSPPVTPALADRDDRERIDPI